MSLLVMTIDEAFHELTLFRESLSRARPEMAFTAEAALVREEPFKRWFRSDMPAKGKSGVYLIADMDREVLYIGKASDLQAEIWSKFKKPTSLEDGDIPMFGKSPLAHWAPDQKYCDLVQRGDVLIATAVIEPAVHASLVEVYLHVWCATHGGLPVLNKRIG